MEITTYALGAVGLALFASANLTMVAIVREVFPHLNPDDQASIRSWYKFGGGASTTFDRALHHAWTEHARAFPESRKRVLLAALLISAALTLFVYPLCSAFGSR